MSSLSPSHRIDLEAELTSSFGDSVGTKQTQPFSEDLHQRVLNYQNELFDAREVNIAKRREEPEMAAQVGYDSASVLDETSLTLSSHHRTGRIADSRGRQGDARSARSRPSGLPRRARGCTGTKGAKERGRDTET